MFNLCFSIGEHYATCQTHSFMSFQFLKKIFSFPSKSSKQYDFSIVIEDGYGEAFTDYKVEIRDEGDFRTYRRADYLIKTVPDYSHATIHVHDKLALKHALMNFYSAYILHHNWGLLIHSSCAVEEGRAHIFTGRSGAGKSTVARLSAPRDLLSDEATLVKISTKGITVFNSPFRSELESTGEETPTSLESINLLRQALSNSRNHLKKSDALIDLIDKVFYWVRSPEETKQILYLLKILVEKVSVYELHFRKNETFWELIS